MTSARDDILARVRRANRVAHAYPEVARDYRRDGPLAPGSPEVLALLERNLTEYRATVHRSGEIAPTVDALLAGAHSTVVPPGLDPSWAPGVAVDDGTLTAADLDRVDAVVTAATAACARTGTIMLDGGPGQGRRMLSLVPDLHVCVVRAEQVVDSVPEMLERVDPVRPLTLISGPSATSDIELQRVEGVHGPRTLHVVLALPAR